MITALRKGDKLAPPGKPENYWEVLDSHLHAGSIEIFDSQKHQSRYVQEADVRQAIARGQLIVQRHGMPRISLATQYDDPTLHARVKLLGDALQCITKIQKQLGISFDAAISHARQEHSEERADPFPFRATLYRARKKQLLGLPLLHGSKNKGNTLPRYSPELLEFIQSEIDALYLKPQSTWTTKQLTDYLNSVARKNELHTKKLNISRKFVISVIDAMTADPYSDRMEPKQRVSKKSFATKRIRAAFPFARIEQDAVHLPFVVRTAEGIARVVYLVIALDVCTGYPLGWRLCIGSPTDTDTLACLQRYMTDEKSQLFKKLNISGALNIYGTPSLIVFDNGPEVRSSRITRLERLGTDIKHCKAREAQGKPFIERLNRSLKEALQQLPGCTRFEGKDGMRDPEALGDPLMTIEELEQWVVRWLYEKWANHPLDRHQWDALLDTDVKGLTPLERLKHSMDEQGTPIPLPPSQQELQSVLYEHVQRALNGRTGISIEHGFRYKGDAIAYLLGKYGDKAQLHVIYNPDDFRQIYVHEADDLPLVPLTHEHVRADTPAWSFLEAKTRFDEIKKDHERSEIAQQFISDIDARVSSSKKSKSKGTSRSKRADNQEVIDRSRSFAAGIRALQNPLQQVLPEHAPPSVAIPLIDKVHAPDYDDVAEMPILNRKTGEKLL